MSLGNPLGSVAETARAVEQALGRAVTNADEQWADAGRRSFDAKYLGAIQADARKLTGTVADLSERLQIASELLAAEGL